jgi:hypothetical protein
VLGGIAVKIGRIEFGRRIGLYRCRDGADIRSGGSHGSHRKFRFNLFSGIADSLIGAVAPVVTIAIAVAIAASSASSAAAVTAVTAVAVVAAVTVVIMVPPVLIAAAAHLVGILKLSARGLLVALGIFEFEIDISERFLDVIDCTTRYRGCSGGRR